jgi:hypothetical protein
LPAQLVGCPVTAHHPLRCQPGNSRASSLGRLDPGLVVGKRGQATSQYSSQIDVK